MIRLGYAGLNTELRDEHIFSSRTARLATIVEHGVELAIDLARKNLDDLMKIFQWNEEHGIRFFRMSSEMFPQITNPSLIPRSKRKDYRALAYRITDFADQLRQLGRYARDHGHRITFHPGQYVILSGSDAIRIRSVRDLYVHAMVLDLMDMNLDSIMIIHGGGVYGDKPVTSRRWVDAFDALPLKIKRRIAIENDEKNYGIDDIMQISRSVKPYMDWQGAETVYKIPIVFDIFHYKCYKSLHPRGQSSITDVLDGVVASWAHRHVKMHISEQRSNGRFGAHSDYVRAIPLILREFPKRYGNLDLMVEAKAKERAVMGLKKKYKICV